ncbi:HAD-IIB family hydrolase [Spiroplasma endosymbiont of Labia minor]|uniref:HAD-IIB family hydrolase n=1 Tax=Spiroplasma endosymbiont of Labia minor TaxID=3066305 RepID=UPI0030D3F09F
MYRFKSLKYLLTAILIISVLIAIGYVSSFIKISINSNFQISDGIFFSLTAFIPGPMMLIVGIIYSPLLDLLMGSIIYMPFTLLIHILMWSVIYFFKKFLTVYVAFLISSILTLLYVLIAFIIYDKTVAILELITDSIQLSISFVISSIIFFSLNRLNKKSKNKIWNDNLFEIYKVKKNTIKWWFTDYDGTFDRSNNDEIDQADLEFAKEWIDGGNQFIIASGRMYNEIKERIEKHSIPYDYIISQNGASLYANNGKLISSHTFSNQQKLKLYNYLKNIPEIALAFCENDQRIEWKYELFDFLKNDKYMGKTYIPEEVSFEQKTKRFMNSKNITVVFVFMKPDLMKSFVEEFNSKNNDMRAVITYDILVEIILSKVSKATAIKDLMSLNRIDINDIYTSGDSYNDVEMLNMTKNSFVMDSAPTNVKCYGEHEISKVSDIKKYILFL